MTPHASVVDPTFSSMFFLTFRLFSSPAELVQAIIDRYNLVPPPGLSEESVYIWQQHKGIPVRLRVSNLIKSWLELYWRPTTDNTVLQQLLDFNRDALSLMFPGPSHRIHEIIVTRKREGQIVPPTPRPDLARDRSMAFSPQIISSDIPRPIMTRALVSQLRNRNFSSMSLTDFDSLELARQLTIMECNLFCAIQPDEILESGQEGSKPPVNVRAVTSLSTVVTGWVAESILNEADDIRRRITLVKFFIKLADVSP
jgi:son of sevenless